MDGSDECRSEVVGDRFGSAARSTPWPCHLEPDFDPVRHAAAPSSIPSSMRTTPRNRSSRRLAPSSDSFVRSPPRPLGGGDQGRPLAPLHRKGNWRLKKPMLPRQFLRVDPGDWRAVRRRTWTDLDANSSDERRDRPGNHRDHDCAVGELSRSGETIEFHGHRDPFTKPHACTPHTPSGCAGPARPLSTNCARVRRLPWA